jgi:hypothetical protein
MHGFAESILVALFAICEYAGVPALLIWGWVRWFKRPEPRTLFPILSFVGFAFATASAVLAFLSMVYANFIGGFAYYDPRLMKIFGLAAVLSLSATAFALGGVWRPSPLRWHALACGVATLMFWLAVAAGE